MTDYAVINETGRANLVAWLRKELAEGRNPEKWADYLLAGFDGGFPHLTLKVELPRTATASQNPATYVFANHEFFLVEDE